MNPCAQFETSIERLLCEEISAAERQRLLTHAEACAACGGFVAMHRRLEALDFGEELPADADFARARRAVIERLQHEGVPRGARASIADLCRACVRQPAWGAALAAALVLALVTGLAVGRGMPRRIELAGLEPPEPFLGELAAESSRARGAPAPADPRYRVSNVSFSGRDDDRLELRFDVTRSVELERRADDPLVATLVARSLAEPAPVGARLATLAHAERAMDERVEEALVVTLLNDPNVAVRLRAMKILAARPPSPRIREAFALVLAGEAAVQLRLEALDHLAADGGGSSELERFLAGLGPEDDPALLARAARIRAGGASEAEAR